MKNCIAILVLAFFTSLSSAQSILSSNISISVSSTDFNYSYSARFDNNKTEAAKNTIVMTLGNPTEETERTAVWKGKGYNVSLRQGKVKMEMVKDEVTKSFRVKIEDLGEEISESVGSVKAPKPPKIR